ncbi:DUF5336 domain-containing protein [Mycobacterium sp. 1482292.6]|uniref:DUF5336 domain-containing protein n=1 Tax=Mycobacterium sp. 1482292.6 TaxID=1834081 RepID=UPI000AB6F849|nr:DUF5336 domain-containing protein [Mycobacterium sp. 1482292.6]
MTDPQSDSASAGYGAPGYTYGGSPLRADSSQRRVNRLRQSLWAAVAVLGPTALAVSLGTRELLGFPVRLSVLAAIVAAVGLLPGQSVRGWIVVTLAVAGLSDTLANWIQADEHRWALGSILALTFLQALAALVALLHEAKLVRSAELAHARDYSAYVRLAQAYQAYAMQYQPSPPEQYGADGQATAHAHAEAAAAARTHATRESYEALQARYARYNPGAPARQSRGAAEVPSVTPVADAGMDRGAGEQHRYRDGQANSGRGIIEPGGP